MSRPTVVGLDLSLTATGIAGADWAKTLKPKNTGYDRLRNIRDSVVLDYTASADLVVVEGPSYGSKTGNQHERAGLWWLIAYALWMRGTPLAVVPPSNLKKYATGSGIADKDRVMASVVRRFDWFDGDNNAADAAVLAAMGYDHLGHPTVTMPQAHREALKAVKWPDLGAELAKAA